MRSTISRLSIWCGAAVVVLAAAGCSSDPVSPGADALAGHPALALGTLPVPGGATSVTLASSSSVQLCGYSPVLDGSVDPSGSCVPSSDLTTKLQSGAIPGNPGWGAPVGTSSWIGAQANANEYQVLPGAYAFQSTFTVPAGSTNRGLNIDIKADNWAAIYLNGTKIGQHNPAEDNSGNFTTAQSFNDAGALIHDGTNTLRIVLTNTRVHPFETDVLKPCTLPPGSPVSYPGIGQFNYPGYDASVCLNPSGISFVATAFYVPQVVAVPMFVIGDVEAHGIGANVNFWGAQWWKNNQMSGITTNGYESFKGYATQVTGSCGGTWKALPGNSGHPPDTIGSDIAIIVTSKVLKSGNNISGDIQQIVMVHQDGGYGPNPGHDGNGPVTSVVCGAAN